MRPLAIAAILAALAACHRGGGTLVISPERPVYPDSLRVRGIEGRVVVVVVVDSTGRAVPGTARVVHSPNPGFDQTAIDFVNAAQFRKWRGRATRALVTVPIDFKINRLAADAVLHLGEVDQAPTLEAAAEAVYPPGVSGARPDVHVLVEAVIDTAGRAEPRSLRIVSTPDPAFARPATAYVLGAQFRPGQVAGRKVRVLMTVDVLFRGGR